MGIEPHNLRMSKDVIWSIRKPTLPAKNFFISVVRHHAVIHAHTIQVLWVANIRVLPVPWLKGLHIYGVIVDKCPLAALRGRPHFLAGLIVLAMCFTSMSPKEKLRCLRSYK